MNGKLLRGGGFACGVDCETAATVDGASLMVLSLVLPLRRHNKVRLRVLDARLDQPRDSLLLAE